jgi:hypothetical protein
VVFLKQPKNETEAHFMLKEIAKYILWSWGYNKLATEVGGMYSYDFRQPNKDFKNVIDVVGAKTIHPFVKGEGYKSKYYEIKGIEAKASLSDFKNGFCAAPAHTYIIAPKGIIPVEHIPDKIGFIEVDFDKFSLKKWSNKIEYITGVELVIKPKRRIDSRFQNIGEYRKWSIDTLERISYRCSQELLFWKNTIEFVDSQ